MPDDETLPSSDDTPATDAPAAGPQSDAARYRVVGTVGRGGLGVVLRAIDQALGRPIALKVMAQHDVTARARFDDEARLAARLEHPGIVPIYDAGQFASGAPYYAMKLVGGRTLAAAIRDAADLGGRLGLLGAVLAVADAIAFAHSRGVIHRDLKPDNVLVGEFGETIVIDWGLAKELDRAEPSPDAAPVDAPPERTAAGDVLGTPAYMAPEQARGEPLDARADVFAIGALLYAVLAGHAPRRGDRARVMADARHTPVDPIERLVPDVPRDLAAICARALAIDRAARYQHARELADDLRRFQTGRLVAAREYSLTQRLGRWLRRHAALVTMGAGSLAVLVIVGTALLIRTVEARHRAEDQAAQLLLAQARATIDRDPALALAWLRRLLAAPGVGAIDLEQVRILTADARARGLVSRTLAGSANTIQLAGTPDGRFAVGRDVVGAVTIWDLDAGRIAARLPGPYRDLAIAPDGASFAAVDAQGVSVRAFDGRELRRGPGAGAVASAGFQGDGRVVVVEPSGEVLAASGARLALDVPITLVRGLASGRVAFAGPRVIGWWDPATGAMARAARDGELFELTASADGALLAVLTSDRTSLFAVHGDAITPVAHPEIVTGVAFDGDARLAWAGRSGIWIRERATDHVFELPWPENAYLAFAGRRLIATNDQARLFVVDELPVAASHRWQRPAGVRYLKPAAGAQVAFFTIAGEVGIVDPATGALTSLAADQRYYGGATVALAVAGAQIVFGGTGVWKADAATHAVTQVAWEGPACIARLASGEVVTVTPEGVLRTYDATVTAARGAIRVLAPVRECAARPDGTLAISHDAGLVSVIDPATGAEVGRDVGASGAAADALAVADDGTIYIGDFGGGVRRWRPGAPSRALFRHDGPVWSLAVSARGLVASSSRDRTVRISTADGRVVQIFRGAADELSHVAFAPDGLAVLASSMDGAILRWPIDPTRAPPATADALAAHLAALTSVAIDAP